MIRRFLLARRRAALSRRFLRDASGAAIVEFALVFPLLLMFLLGILEFGRVWNVRQVLTDATREGARVAVVNNNRPGLTASQLQDSVRRTVRRRLVNAALDTAATRLTIGLTNVGAQPGATPATVTVTYNYPLQFAPLASFFGGTAPKDGVLPLRSTFVMRNE